MNSQQLSLPFSKITFCLTSCNRFDLLQITLDSFFNLNTFPIDRFIITEDSANQEMKNKILNRYGNKIELIFNEVNLGIYKSIDNMYKTVNTEYIFHCEDDWRFDTNPNFMQQSLSILEERKDIHQIWIRKDADPNWIESETFKTVDGVNYKMLKKEHCGDWNGKSLNPGAFRLSDYNLMFPNGYAEFILPDKKAVFTEHNCMLNTKKFNYRAAILEQTSCVHIGDGRSTIA